MISMKLFLQQARRFRLGETLLYLSDKNICLIWLAKLEKNMIILPLSLLKSVFIIYSIVVIVVIFNNKKLFWLKLKQDGKTTPDAKGEV